MKERNLLRRGIVGSAVAAVCCFTPALVILVSAVGLSAVIGYLDYVLFPLLFSSLGMVAQALYLRSGKTGPRPKGLILAAVVALSAGLFWLDFRFALRISIGALAAVAVYGYYLRTTANRQSGDKLAGDKRAGDKRAGDKHAGDKQAAS